MGGSIVDTENKRRRIRFPKDEEVQCSLIDHAGQECTSCMVFCFPIACIRNRCSSIFPLPSRPLNSLLIRMGMVKENNVKPMPCLRAMIYSSIIMHCFTRIAAPTHDQAQEHRGRLYMIYLKAFGVQRCALRGFIERSSCPPMACNDTCQHKANLSLQRRRHEKPC